MFIFVFRSHEKYTLMTKLQEFLLSDFGVVVFTLVVGTIDPQ